MGRPESKSKQEPRVVELSIDDLLALDGRAELEQFERGDGELVRLLIASHREVLEQLKSKEITLARLRRMLFGASTEKTKDILAPEEAKSDAEPPPEEQAAGTNSTDSTDSPDEEPRKPGRKGHGRNGAKDYPGAKKVSVSHETLQAGDDCPECGDGTLYER